MEFDFDWFTRLVKQVYPEEHEGLYNLNETLAIFGYFFSAYERYMGMQHPPLRTDQIERIICAMPSIPGESYDDVFCPDPEEYELMIDRYFETDYGRCDYRINHFFSGRIREIKYYETCY